MDVMENVIEEKSIKFAVRIFKLCRYLNHDNGTEVYMLSKQLLKSGTSIGANIAEAEQAQSRADFSSKMSIALKETVETIYWLKLLRECGFLSAKEYESITVDCTELKRLLVSIVKKSKDCS